MKKQTAWLSCCVGAAIVSACAGGPKPAAAPTPATAAAPGEVALVPLPASMERGSGGFTITDRTLLAAATNDPAAQRVAQHLITLIRRSTGINVPRNTESGPNTEGTIVLRLDEQQASLGREGYELTIGAQSLRLVAATPAGLFYGVQTIRQLLPRSSEYEAVLYDKPRPVMLPALTIRDHPRYEWRGAMLDVARHFFTVEEVQRYIDLLALHKMNRLHLHLADDQGWRIEIKKWPDLTAKGGALRSRRHAGRVLHAGAVRADRRLRGRTIHHDRSRDRHAGPHQRRALVLRGTELQRRGGDALHRHRGRLQRAVRRQGGHLPLHRRRRRRDRGDDAGRLLPCRAATR